MERGKRKESEAEPMTRTFTIKDAPNDHGFDRFAVAQDNGRPYMENGPVITTNDPVVLFRALAEFLKGEE